MKEFLDRLPIRNAPEAIKAARIYKGRSISPFETERWFGFSPLGYRLAIQLPSEDASEKLLRRLEHARLLKEFPGYLARVMPCSAAGIWPALWEVRIHRDDDVRNDHDRVRGLMFALLLNAVFVYVVLRVFIQMIDPSFVF